MKDGATSPSIHCTALKSAPARSSGRRRTSEWVWIITSTASPRSQSNARTRIPASCDKRRPHAQFFRSTTERTERTEFVFFKKNLFSVRSVRSVVDLAFGGGGGGAGEARPASRGRGAADRAGKSNVHGLEAGVVRDPAHALGDEVGD